jgi:hypothetical protein
MTTATAAGTQTTSPGARGLRGALASRWPTGVGIGAAVASLALVAPLP